MTTSCGILCTAMTGMKKINREEEEVTQAVASFFARRCNPFKSNTLLQAAGDLQFFHLFFHNHMFT